MLSNVTKAVFRYHIEKYAEKVSSVAWMVTNRKKA